MLVWRITPRLHAANPLSGEGAARYANRWNSKGVRVGYTSSSRPLAVLEMLVHVTRDTVPDDLVLLPIEVPDAFITEARDLPAKWNDFPYRDDSRAVGDAWIKTASSAALLVPSAVLPRERNLLINPLHPQFSGIRIHPAEQPALDPRLFR
ncbi:MAG: RES family NAD+ phosphorylase [Acidobacteriota bacterium]